MRFRFGYFTPEEFYEATLDWLVTPGCTWLDVGCGRHVLPGNPGLARLLADRCATLVGVDPDRTIDENQLVHEKFRGSIDQYYYNNKFDIVSLRMVAEHITDPDSAASALARLTKRGGRVVLYTINRWSPVSMISWIIPFAFHHPIKKIIWKTEEKDTFPTAYRMNTRQRLLRLFEGHGFREEYFAHLDDCRTFASIRPLLFMELVARRIFNSVGLGYPETCLLGVYERVQASCSGHEDSSPTGGDCPKRLSGKE
jgi:SAM-dependent methyltransferase